MYVVKNIRDGPSASLYYDMWILTLEELDEAASTRFTEVGRIQNGQPTPAGGDEAENEVVKCCMTESGDFDYGAYGLDYNNNIIARRVIAYDKTSGIESVMDEAFFHVEGSTATEEFYRKVYGRLNSQLIDVGVRENGVYDTIARIQSGELGVQTTELTCPGQPPRF